jgi:hypothetical protein
MVEIYQRMQINNHRILQTIFTYNLMQLYMNVIH